MTDQDEALFQRSCNEVANFPKNLIYQASYEHILDAYHRRLNDNSDRLFTKSGADVELWEYRGQSTGMVEIKRSSHRGFSKLLISRQALHQNTFTEMMSSEVISYV